MYIHFKELIHTLSNTSLILCNTATVIVTKIKLFVILPDSLQPLQITIQGSGPWIVSMGPNNSLIYVKHYWGPHSGPKVSTRFVVFCRHPLSLGYHPSDTNQRASCPPWLGHQKMTSVMSDKWQEEAQGCFHKAAALVTGGKLHYVSIWAAEIRNTDPHSYLKKRGF